MQRRAAILDEKLAKLVADYPGYILERRGTGFLRGLKLADRINVGDMTASLRRKKLLVVPAGENVLRLLPPLTITEDEIEQACHILDEAFSHLDSA